MSNTGSKYKGCIVKIEIKTNVRETTKWNTDRFFGKKKKT